MENATQSLCTACGLCCNGVLFQKVWIKPEDDVEPLLAGGLVIHKDAEQPSFQQPCACYRNQHCSIYSYRPQICRRFKCKLLQRYEAGQVAFERAKDIIRQTTDQAEQVLAYLQTAGAEGCNLMARYGAWEKSQADAQSATWTRRNGAFLLNYTTLMLRLERHFQREKKGKNVP